MRLGNLEAHLVISSPSSTRGLSSLLKTFRTQNTSVVGGAHHLDNTGGHSSRYTFPRAWNSNSWAPRAVVLDKPVRNLKEIFINSEMVTLPL
jgi:hypothetical protein